MPKKDNIKKEVELKTHTLTESERAGVDVKANETTIRWQTRGVFFGLIVLLVVLIAGIVTWLFRGVFFSNKADRGQVVFAVNNKKFYSKDIQAMQAEAGSENVDANSALNVIIDAETRRAAAASLNIEVPDNKLFNSTSNWQKEHNYSTALDSVVKQAEIGGYQVAVFYLPFSRLQLPPNGLNKKPEGWRDGNAIAQDRAYAQNKAQSYRKKLLQKETTTEQAITEIHKDMRLTSGPSSNKSVELTVNENGEVLAAGQEYRFDKEGWIEDVKKLSDGQYTEVKVGKVTLFDLSDQPSVDGYFYFVGLEKRLNPQPGLSDKLNEAIKQVKVERK